jgi:hypothetical protein
MPFSKFTTFLFLVAFVLFIQNVLVVYDYDCLSVINFTSNDYYETSLNDVMDYLTYETPSTGLGLGSRGHGLGRTYSELYAPAMPCSQIARAVYPTQQTKFPHFGHIVKLQSYGTTFNLHVEIL